MIRNISTCILWLYQHIYTVAVSAHVYCGYISTQRVQFVTVPHMCCMLYYNTIAEHKKFKSTCTHWSAWLKSIFLSIYRQLYTEGLSVLITISSCENRFPKQNSISHLYSRIRLITIIIVRNMIRDIVQKKISTDTSLLQ